MADVNKLFFIIVQFRYIFYVNAVKSTSGFFVERYRCTEERYVSTSLDFRPVETTAQCVAQCVNDCIAIYVKRETDAVHCELISHRENLGVQIEQSLSSCSNVLSKVIVYKIIEIPPYYCEKNVTAYGRFYCISSPGTTASTFPVATSICSSLGGILPVAQTQADLDVVMSLFNNSPVVWAGLNDLDVQDVWTWPDGNVMTSGDLWEIGEPSQSFERCAYIRPNLNRLFDNQCNAYPYGASIACFFAQN